MIIRMTVQPILSNLFCTITVITIFLSKFFKPLLSC